MNHKEKLQTYLGYTPEEADQAIKDLEADARMSKTDTIDFDFDLLDDGSSNNAGSNSGWSQPANVNYGSINVNGSIGGSSAGVGGLTSNGVLKFTANTISSSSGPVMSINIGGGEKYMIQYIIVLSDGSCLELNEDQKITPREAIGITKFLNLVQMAMVSGGANLQFDWSIFIEELGISRHFTAGLGDYNKYKTDEEVLYVFLFDPKL